MRKLASVLVIFFVFILTAAAQETRGTIAGTVVDEQGGSVPGVAITITNVDTNVSSTLTTNASGYFEAALLLPGNYQVTAELQGFKTAVRSGIVLSVAQRLNLPLQLQIGTMSESISVSGEAPLLDTAALTTGQNFDRRTVDSVPMFANMPVLLTRFVSGVNSSDNVPWVAQGYVNRTSLDTSSPGGVATNEWTIDGVTNGGSDRRLASSPNSDMIEEVRIETANFDASFGHGTGLGISMMTRAGSNTPRGTVSYQHWNGKLNAPNYFQREVFNRTDLPSLARKAAFEAGRSHNMATTFGGPVVIPGIVNGTGKLFFFANYSYDDSFRAGQTGGNNTVPTLANLEGDFSNLLAVDPVRYQIYDPLTVRPDPARPGHFIRDPFPGNIIPKDRIVNPMYQHYKSFLPVPNQDPTNPRVEPFNNYFSGAEPDPIKSQIYGARFDYNHSDKNRYFVRWSGSYFTEGLGDWTYESMPGLHSRDTLRKTTAGTFSWTNVKSTTTLFDAQLSANKYHEGDRWLGAARYKPSDVGLPAYMDERCAVQNACSLPRVQAAGYATVGGIGSGLGVADNPGWWHETTNLQGIFKMTSVRDKHTLTAGVDIRQHFRSALSPGDALGQFIFDNTYTRRNDDTAIAPAGNLGLSWAAFMLGIPTQMNAPFNSEYSTHSPYYAGYVQESWRATRSLTFNLGLRYELEQGITEQSDSMVVGFDPNLNLEISDLAESWYVRQPVPELAGPQFQVKGGAIYPGSNPYGRRASKTQQLLMPRAALAWQPDDRLVVKGGYGVYYDSINATHVIPNQLGFSNTTASSASNDFGQTWNMGDPRRGVSPLTNPFPARFESVYGDALGADIVSGMTGTFFDAPNLERERMRMQRWRVGVQRELTANTAVEVSYIGSYADGVEIRVRQDVLPEQYWNQTNSRNNALISNMNSNVPNPFHISHFESLRRTDPLVYSRIASLPFFNQPTVQKHNLLRAYPHISGGLRFDAQPLGKVKTHAIEVLLQRRFSRGLSANVSYTGMRAKEWMTVLNEYDLAPTRWITSQAARPHRVTASGLYQLPFGSEGAYLKTGVAGAVLGNWQIGTNFEYQPGPLLEWPNLFFNGNIDDIKVDDPTLERWFNVDAGFERNAARAPSDYQARVFPTRIDGLRAHNTVLVNASFQRSFRMVGRARLQARVDVHNLLNRDHFNPPQMNPTNTQFGWVTASRSTANRFLTFIGKLTF